MLKFIFLEFSLKRKISSTNIDKLAAYFKKEQMMANHHLARIYEQKLVVTSSNVVTTISVTSARRVELMFVSSIYRLC